MPHRLQLSQKDIDSLLDTAEVREFTFFDRDLMVSYKLPCGFVIIGKGDCDNGKCDIGSRRKRARQDATKQLWELETYRLQWRLYEQQLGKCRTNPV